MKDTYILENMDTEALAADKGYEFLFVLGQPRRRGGVQAMINPIAIRYGHVAQGSAALPSGCCAVIAALPNGRGACYALFRHGPRPDSPPG